MPETQTVTVNAYHPYPAFYWEVKPAGGVPRAIDDNYPAYQSGQGTKTVGINATIDDVGSIRCTVGPLSAGVPTPDAEGTVTTDWIPVSVGALTWDVNPGSKNVTIQAVIQSTWWVRPNDKTYGLRNGTSYENAWSGLQSIDWGVVKGNDIIEVRGQHINRATKNDTGEYNWEPQRENITLSGSSAAGHEDDKGEIWGLYEDARSGGIGKGWTSLGDGIYECVSDNDNRAYTQQGVWEVGTPPVRIASASSAVNVGVDGDYFIEDGGGSNNFKITYKPTNGDNTAIRFSGLLNIRPSFSAVYSNTTWKNIEFHALMVHERFQNFSGATIDGCLVDGQAGALSYLFSNGGNGQTNTVVDNLTVSNSTFRRNVNAIYFFNPTSCVNHVYSGNVFEDINKSNSPDGAPNQDAHAIGNQGCQGLLVDGNVFRRCNNGFDNHVDQKNSTGIVISNNYFEDIINDGDVANGIAILFEGAHGYTGTTDEIHIYNNIINGTDGGGVSTARQTRVNIYNNTFINCYRDESTGNAVAGAIKSYNEVHGIRPPLYIYNNIFKSTFEHSKRRHIHIQDNFSDLAHDLHIDNNIYEGADKFGYRSAAVLNDDVDFASWPGLIQTATGLAGQEASSSYARLGLRGALVAEADFIPADSSGAIGAGTNAPSGTPAEDYFGVARPSPPGAGACEHVAGALAAPVITKGFEPLADYDDYVAFSVPLADYVDGYGNPAPTFEIQAEATKDAGDYSNAIETIFDGKATVTRRDGVISFDDQMVNDDSRKIRCEVVNSQGTEETVCNLDIGEPGVDGPEAAIIARLNAVGSLTAGEETAITNFIQRESSFHGGTGNWELLDEFFLLLLSDVNAACTGFNTYETFAQNDPGDGDWRASTAGGVAPNWTYAAHYPTRGVGSPTGHRTDANFWTDYAPTTSETKFSLNYGFMGGLVESFAEDTSSDRGVWFFGSPRDGTMGFYYGFSARSSPDYPYNYPNNASAINTFNESYPYPNGNTRADRMKKHFLIKSASSGGSAYENGVLLSTNSAVVSLSPDPFFARGLGTATQPASVNAYFFTGDDPDGLLVGQRLIDFSASIETLLTDCGFVPL